MIAPDIAATLVAIPTPTTPLDGLWYEPAGKVRGAVLLFHGNTMNFYTGSLRFLPPMLLGLGYACLAFNRRGHDILAIRDSRGAEGAAFQSIAQAREDNALAAQWVAGRGFGQPLVIGHSNGGMLAVRHVADHPETPALALLSAHCGGKRIAPLMARGGLLAGDQFDEVGALARARVAEGRGSELLRVPGWWYVVSAATYVDWLDNVPDVLELAPQVRCPSLYVRGDQESAESYPAEEFARRAGGPCEVQILPNCDHFYKGREEVAQQCVREWLEKL